MKLTDYIKVIGEKLTIEGGFKDSGFWHASFEGGEVLNDMVLTSYVGRGSTPMEAVEDYLSKIRGQTLVFRAMSQTRSEYHVPEDLKGDDLWEG